MAIMREEEFGGAEVTAGPSPDPGLEPGRDARKDFARTGKNIKFTEYDLRIGVRHF